MRIYDQNNPMPVWQMIIDNFLSKFELNANLHLHRWWLSINTSLAFDGVGYEATHTKWLGSVSLELTLILAIVKITIGYPHRPESMDSMFTSEDVEHMHAAEYQGRKIEDFIE